MALNIVLVEPEIPQNTGNIVRTCSAIEANLHLIRPLGFSVEDKYLKRAGLDYWYDVNINYYDSFDELRNKYNKDIFYYATTKGAKIYSDFEFPEDCFIVFGKETKGLPEDLLRVNYEYCMRIPMKGGIRSLNLSNSVAIVAYEILRQHGFEDLKVQGEIPTI